MKIYTLGTSAGTQPYAGSHHVSTAVETGGSLYFIDAGECCGYTAKLSGADLLDTRAVFITHPHMDHTGGLGNLLWYVRKMNNVNKEKNFSHDNITVCAPIKDIYDATMLLLKNTEGGFATSWSHSFTPVAQGEVYRDENIKVTAFRTHHMEPVNGIWQSYAFRIEAEGKTLVFSGDIKLDDFDDVLPESCDAFFAETGHHRIETVCEKIKETGKNINNLFFTHNGGYIMLDKESAKAEAKAAFGENAVVCSDGEIYTL